MFSRADSQVLGVGSSLLWVTAVRKTFLLCSEAVSDFVLQVWETLTFAD